MISEVRLNENKELLRSHLIPLHEDKDNNSLYVRFAEILDYMESLKFKNDLYERCSKAIAENKDIK